MGRKFENGGRKEPVLAYNRGEPCRQLTQIGRMTSSMYYNSQHLTKWVSTPAVLDVLHLQYTTLVFIKILTV